MMRYLSSIVAVTLLAIAMVNVNIVGVTAEREPASVVKAGAKKFGIDKAIDISEADSMLHIQYTSAARSVPNVCGDGPDTFYSVEQTVTLNPFCTSVEDCRVAPITTVNQPSISWTNTRFDELSTLALVDLGHVPGTDQPFVHMLVLNIPGDSIAAGDHVYRYFMPSNPSNVTHVYTWMLWNHENPINLSANDKKAFTGFGGRGNFNPAKFNKDYKLGGINALNWMMQSVDLYVAFIWRWLPSKADTWMGDWKNGTIGASLAKMACGSLNLGGVNH